MDTLKKAMDKAEQELKAEAISSEASALNEKHVTNQPWKTGGAVPNWGSAPSGNETTRVALLRTAAALTSGDRDKEYGNPVRNMAEIAEFWSVYLHQRHGAEIDITPGDVAKMMALMKIIRTHNPNAKPDSYADGACYIAIAGECEL